MKCGRVLALLAWVCLYTSSALAEGSADLDVGETLWNGATGNRANDQAVSGATVIRVDIASNGAEKVCWTGAGTMQLQRPNGTNVGSAVASGACVSAVASLVGAYFADIGNQTVGSEWDIRVCLSGVSDALCLSNPANEQLGRVWSSAWSFQQNTNFGNDYAINGSVFAVVPGGAVGRDAVVELKMNGVSGAYYVLRANSTGPVITSSQVRFGRSVPTGGIYSVNAEYPLYLSPPAGAQYNWTPPVVSDVQLTPSCGTGVVLGRAAGLISFTSNVTGQYVVVCDVNKDSSYDFAGTADFSSFGAAVVGTNSISWDGRNNALVNAAEGTYQCVIRLNVGEFHYVAEDIETSYPGIRMFRVESNKTTKTPIRMFWDDSSAVLGSGSNTMLNGQASPSSPLADGLDPTAYATASAAFYFTGGNRALPNGNARAWHDFSGSGTGTGKGNNNFLDQFAAADTAISPAISISVISNSGDADTDGLINSRECDLGSLPQDNDTDNDGVNDGYEATTTGTSTDTDGDLTLDILDTDDDGDSVLTSAELGAGENGDGNPSDAANTDTLGARDYLDTDSDNDGVLDGVDIARTNPLSCRDVDADNCDDCSATGANSSGGSISNDGLDTNADGQCNLTDTDDDGDGVLDGADASPLVATICSDLDLDGCNDCAVTGANNSGGSVSNDGTDSDSDGACDAGDPDDDNDGVADASDSAPLNPSLCRDLDADSCNDCAVTGANNSGGSVSNDGTDTDADGRCDTGDSDDDNDGVADGSDSAPLVATVCRDADVDSCNDCAITGANNSGGSVSNDGTDTDLDGLCNTGDSDDDNDGVADGSDSSPLVATLCRDVDADGCNDCAITGANNSGGSVSNDGTDTDSDGRCDAGDTERDGDGVPDGQDSAPDNPNQCRDVDTDSCDDCINTGANGSGGSVTNDGSDSDSDGLCNAGDPDDDNDGVADGADSTPLNASVCRDVDADGCDDCGLTGNNNSGGSVAGDGLDSDLDGLCDAGDPDRDNDGVPNAQDSAPLDRNVCRDADSDGCNDCARGTDNGNDDGVDNDGDGKCDGASDFDMDGIPDNADLDDDGDGILDSQENTAGINPDADADNDGISNQFDADNRGDGSANACAHSRVAGACDAPSLLFDQDGDGKPNHLDLDADGDGLRDASESGHDGADANDDGRVDGPVGTNGVADAVEDAVDSGNVARAINTDGDDLPNFLDVDSDGDNVGDKDDAQPRDAMRCRDRDDDGCDDCTSGYDDVSADGRDQDGDGKCDAPTDHDGDGVPDADDLDDDGDGILDARENPDGIDPDADHDGDGISNQNDANDRGDGTANDCQSLSNVRCEASGRFFDQDADGIPNHLDLDADGDGIFDSDESGHNATDKNADGRVDGPVGANGVADAVETAPDSGTVVTAVDTDGDGQPDFLDLDSDGDSMADADEAGDDSPSTVARDTDEDGTPDYRDLDDDDDGNPTADELGANGEQIDRDEDGEPDYRDADDDDDGISTRDERTAAGADIDTDRDGTPNHLDQDDDGDGVLTLAERTSSGRDIDTDEDGKPDHLDVDDDGDGIPTENEAEDADGDGVPDRLQPKQRGTLSGGALCSFTPNGTGGMDASLLALLALAGALIVRRRRPSATRRAGCCAKRLGLLAMGLGLGGASGSARAQVALEQFKPAPLASDGFGLSRPEVLARGSWSTLVWLDYANDPLVYELTSGSSQQEERVVSQHLVGHVGAAVGVLQRLTLFATLPVHLVMKGEKELSVDAPKPEGAGLGDLALGGRVQLSGLDPETVFSSAVEFIARVPTAELANKDQHYSGDAIGSYEPALLGEVRAGRFDVRLRAGVRLRQKQTIGNLTLGQEWVGGLGMRLRVSSTVYLHGEVYGSTFMNSAFERTTTPVESLFGAKHQGEDWNVGVAAGPGLCRGYGSPDVRVVGMLGYAPHEAKPVDSDGDGLLDPNDRCPTQPEDLDRFEDSDGCPDPDNDKDGILDAADSCVDEPEDTDDFEDVDGCPDPDNDKDGILDPNDACPLEPEDVDQFEDSDGCVDPDNDRDGILDAADSCRDQPEDLDGFEDADGCPEEGGGQVRLGCTKLELGDTVYFDTGKDSIQARSFPLLDQVSSLIKSATHIKQLRIAGHTDDRGNDKKNLDLSQRRAASVLRYLVAHGVLPERLSSEGYGESQPVAGNKTEQGRAQNRRVEFQIIEQSGECQ